MFHTTLLLVTGLFASTSNNQQLAKNVQRADSILEKEVGDLSGYYSCDGREGVGKPYSGVAMLTKKNEVYVVQWMVGGGSGFTGVGIRQGDHLSVSWAMSGEKGIVRGVNVYRIESGPRFVGRWATLPGDGAIRSETLTYLKKLPED